VREALAERLLAQVMNWTAEDVAQERPLLQAMADLKYNEYQQFSPGMRFVESLALWLDQFKSADERRAAYNFVKQRLVFFSNAEIAHLVSTAYPDHIKPILLQHAASSLNIPERYISKIANSPEFRILKRRCLFLGLSDGARIDVFRRSNTELSHEQIWQTYDISPEKAESMRKELKTDLEHITGEIPSELSSTFRMIFLLDDFSGSGFTYLRKDEETGGFKGKIYKFYNQLTNEKNGLYQLIDKENLYIYIVFYIATNKSRSSIEEMLHELLNDACKKWRIRIVQFLEEDVSLKNSPDDAPFLDLIELYYDPGMDNKITMQGGTDVKRGFAGCALPLILSHNTPNNSVALLWADPELYKIRGLFPRVSRHRSEP
jgi:hypothetical protein